ncbi:MAG: hypothetical protein LLF94_03965 [Chlamydiales bacterium]|nr:hypothetical protein [Chlamydiales bacterium]
MSSPVKNYPFRMTYAELDTHVADLKAKGVPQEFIDIADYPRHPLTYATITGSFSLLTYAATDRESDNAFALTNLVTAIAALAAAKLHNKGDVAAFQTTVRSYLASSGLWLATAIMEDVTGQRWIRPIIGAAAAPLILKGATTIADKVLAFFKGQ